MKLQCFTTCSPFTGDRISAQRLAMYTWRKLPFPTIVYTTAQQYDDVHFYTKDFAHISLRTLPNTRQRINIESDSVMLDDMMQDVLINHNTDIFVMLNSDIALTDTNLPSLMYLLRYGFKDVCGWSRRFNCADWTLNVSEQLFVQEDQLSTLPLQPHSYAGYDLFFWTKEMMQKQALDCGPFVYSGWQTDHYINKWQLDHCNNCFEITDHVTPIHLEHSSISTRSSEWVHLRDHNALLFDSRNKKKFPRPPMLTHETLECIRNGFQAK